MKNDKAWLHVCINLVRLSITNVVVGELWCEATTNFKTLAGLHRSWNTWKVMKFKNIIFQASKVMEFNCWSCKVMEN